MNDAEYHHIGFDDCVVNYLRIANERHSSDTLSLLDPLCTLGILGNPLDDAPDALFESGRCCRIVCSDLVEDDVELGEREF